MATTSRSRLRNVLVAGEVAAALLLVIGCGVMLKSFARLSQVDLGFRPEGLLSFEMELPPPSTPPRRNSRSSGIGFSESSRPSLA
jgi:hypothetical protein